MRVQLSEKSKAEFIELITKDSITCWFEGDEFVIPSGQGKTAKGIVLGKLLVWQYRQTEVDDLQKRVDALELTIKGAVTFVDLQIEATEQGREAAIGTQAKNWWSSKLLMLRPIRRVLEQALKGGSNE